MWKLTSGQFRKCGTFVILSFWTGVVAAQSRKHWKSECIGGGTGCIELHLATLMGVELSYIELQWYGLHWATLMGVESYIELQLVACHIKPNHLAADRGLRPAIRWGEGKWKGGIFGHKRKGIIRCAGEMGELSIKADNLNHLVSSVLSFVTNLLSLISPFIYAISLFSKYISQLITSD